MDEAIRMLPQVLALDCRTVRQRFEQRPAARRQDCAQVYRSLLNGHAHGRAASGPSRTGKSMN
jgi:hypothetical protein